MTWAWKTFLLVTAASQQVDLGQLSGRALVISDWGCGRDPAACPDEGKGQRAVARAMDAYAMKHQVDFVLNAGDAFYPYGVADDADPQWNSTFESVYHASLEVPWYGVLGNHDWHRNHSALLRWGPRWRMPAPHYVVTEHVNDIKVAFIFLDTNVVMAQDICRFRNKSDWGPLTAVEFERCQREVRDVFAAQLPWLEGRLEELGDALKIVIAHQPVVPATGYWGTFGDDDPAILEKQLLPILQRHHVQFYIAGHDHFFQHLKTPGHMDVFVVGSGGGELEDRPFSVPTTGSVLHTQAGAFGFGILELSGDRFCLTWRPAHGQGDAAEYNYCREVKSFLEMSSQTAEPASWFRPLMAVFLLSLTFIPMCAARKAGAGPANSLWEPRVAEPLLSQDT